MQQRKVIIEVILAVVIIVVGLFLWQKNGKEGVSLENPPQIPAFVIGGLPSEQQQEVLEFKAKILNRVTSRTSLTSEEKAVITRIITTPDFSYRYGFSPDELATIESALARE